MRCARLISIGDELLDGSRVDTNAAWLAAVLSEQGFDVLGTRVVPDVVEDIAEAISASAVDVDLLILTGGLGPTPDDVTRSAMAVAMGCELVQHHEATAWVEQCLSERGMEAQESQLAMGRCPAGASWEPNPIGTAPLLHCTVGEAKCWVLPGPPKEMQLAWEELVSPTLLSGADSELWRSRVYSHGLLEADAASRLGTLLDRSNDIVLGTRISKGIFIVSIVAKNQAEGRRVHADVEERLAPHAFNAQDVSLSEAVGRTLLESNGTVAVAESCTGGSIGGMVSATAGCSAWFHGGVVTYTNDSKVRELSVSPSHFESDGAGAVSRVVATEMARGVRARFATTWSISVTGIAGPSGGTAEQPVGTVWISVAGPRGIVARRCQFSGDRSVVQFRTCLSALQLLRLCVLGRAEDEPLIWEQER
jgi:nicotinamide-nucleotide amidase